MILGCVQKVELTGILTFSRFCFITEAAKRKNIFNEQMLGLIELPGLLAQTFHAQ